MNGNYLQDSRQTSYENILDRLSSIKAMGCLSVHSEKVHFQYLSLIHLEDIRVEKGYF